MAAKSGMTKKGENTNLLLKIASTNILIIKKKEGNLELVLRCDQESFEQNENIIE